MNGRQRDTLPYGRMSTADIRRARQLAHGDKDRLDDIIAEKIAAQLTEARDYAAGEDWPVREVYADNMISGAARYRAAGQEPVERIRMLADIKARGVPVRILVTEVSRLYRDEDECGELVRLARLVPVIVSTVDDEHYDLTTVEGESAFRAVVNRAARESGTVSRRRRRKEARRAKEGGYWGNNPFGHHKVYDTDPDTGQRYYTGRLELCDETCPGRDGCMNTRPVDADLAEDYVGDPPPAQDGTFRPPLAGNPLMQLFTWSGEAGLIRAAAKWLVGSADEPGRSLHAVVKAWDYCGVRSRNGKRISQPQLRNLLLNKRMNGTRVHRPGDKWGRAPRNAKGAETPNAFPKILDDDLFLAVRGVLMSPERFKHLQGGNARKHLLAGIAVCGNTLPDGSVCGAKMKGNPIGRPRKDGTRIRQYTCPPVPDGCGHCRRSVEVADAWVIEHVLRWTAPDGPYAQYVARELELYQASQASASAELARIDTEQREAASLRAGIITALATGEIKPGSAQYDVNMAAIDQIDTGRQERARREAALRASTPPAPVDKRHATLAAILPDETIDIGVRSEEIRSFVARVVISPPGQGARFHTDTGSIDVIPGAWADGLPAADLAACAPVAARPREDMRGRIRAYLEDHPGSASRDIAAAVGCTQSSVCSALVVMRDAGEVAPDRPGRGGPAPILYTLTGHDSEKALWAAQLPRRGMGGMTAREAITKHLADNPGSDAAAIADQAGIPRPTIYAVVKEMRDAGEIIPDRPGRGTKSQPILYTLAG